jgi:O-antigen biosynthesis protein WbqV
VSNPLDNLDWSGFLGRPRLASPEPQVFDALYRQPMLITGAGGSMGTQLALRLAALMPPHMLLLESSESSLYALKRAWRKAGAAASQQAYLGHTSDQELMDRLFAHYKPQLVFHTASYKHVPLLEEHPRAAIHNNVIATETLVQAAARSGARVVMLSTDKAVRPVSIQGATKRAAEQIVLAAGGVVLRLGNVLGSRDSVDEIFAQQIEYDGPMTVTDPAARRLFMTLDEAVNVTLMAAAQPVPSALLAPVLPATHFVTDLARFLASRLSPDRPIAIDFIGRRAGDREVESLWAESDPVQPAAPEFGQNSLVYVEAPRLSAEQVGIGLANLRAAMAAFDITAAIQQLRYLVPDYGPGAEVLELARQLSEPISQ